ncbi:hypothetical protein [Candidatus Frankia nodulisporulans]|uniref:hypothetical protein n=1 Tax=Candidatus Frankia nodulisporulans TaxID=2060052 RepID=UPI0013CFA86D|nr:hypothetical protein [Candidatus Frankia nodulisporulans]
MNRNPAIHRQPSGDIDIALAEPEPGAAGAAATLSAATGPGTPGSPATTGASVTAGALADGVVASGHGGA